MQNRITLFAVLLFALALGACKKEKAADSNTIKIGQFASLTGKEATFGQEVDNGMKLAVDEINAAGGVNGKKIELITEDTQSQTSGAQNAVEKLVGSDGVVALVGEVASGRSMAAAPTAMRAKVPMLSPASTNPKVTVDDKGNVQKYVFRICFIDPFQGLVLANFTHNELKAMKAAILIDNANAYSVGLADGFRKQFTALGGTIVEEQSYEGGQQDFKAQLTAIKAKNPDVLFLPGYYTEVGLIAQQARQLGLTVPLVGGDGWDSPDLTKGAAKEALEGAYFSNHYSDQDTSARVQEFIKKYKAKGTGGSPGAMAALGYDAMNIIAKVMKDAGKSDAETITTGLANLKDYPGVTGNITIDPNHNASKAAVILQIKDGKFTYHSTVAP